MISRFRAPRPCGPRWLRSWMERHQHPTNFGLHLAGIPLTLAAVPALAHDVLWAAAVLFVGGYALQFLGHALEGNDAGEWLLVKRLFGRRGVAVAPPPAQTAAPAASRGR